MLDITNKIPKCNYSIGRDGYKVKAIILHITGDSNKGQAISWFENPDSKVSAHFVIEKDGLVYMCVNPANKAYHAGVVNKPTAQIYFDNYQINPNLYTVGIECVSSGEPLTNEQYTSLLQLINDLCNSYSIPFDRYHITGHFEFDSVNRKFDPIASYSVDNIVHSLNKGEDIMSKDEAIKVLTDERVINSPEYWIKAIDVCNHFDQFVINVATKIQELKNKI